MIKCNIHQQTMYVRITFYASVADEKHVPHKYKRLKKFLPLIINKKETYQINMHFSPSINKPLSDVHIN